VETLYLKLFESTEGVSDTFYIAELHPSRKCYVPTRRAIARLGSLGRLVSRIYLYVSPHGRCRGRSPGCLEHDDMIGARSFDGTDDALRTPSFRPVSTDSYMTPNIV
jgi:hypothetical protein